MDQKRELIERVRANVPALLRELPVWLLHDSNKQPYYVNGESRHGAMDTPEDRAHFVTFETAAEALLTVHRACGLGVALGEVPGEELQLSGIDLDDCYHGEALDERAQRILLAADSYAEKSPSLEGLHILGTGELGTTNNGAGLEIYSGARFFTVTGSRVNGARLADITDAARLAREVFDADKPAAAVAGVPSGADNEIVAALKTTGLYLRDGAAGKHLVRCPWEARHTPGEHGERNTSSTEAAYFAPGAVVRGQRLDVGMFKCQHNHCANRRLGHLREFLGLDIAAMPATWEPPAVATYGAGFDAAKIPLRRWLIGRRRSVGEVTVDAGPPGVNKSTLMLCDAVAIATGRKILADPVHERGEALYLAGEDARRDVEARLAGILAHFHIPAAELDNKLHVVYLAEIDPVAYTLADMVDDMATLNTHMLEWLREYPGAIAVFIDPLAAWHRLIENSNEALQLLCTSLRSIAVQGNRHVGVDHHVTKITMSDPEGHVGNLAAVRGAGAITAYTRWAFTLAKLNEQTAEDHGIAEEERRRYRRLDALKASYGPDDDRARLLRVESVPIANGESVGVLVEVDTERTRADAYERKAVAATEAQKKLAAALTRMLTERRPRTASAAALWLITQCPELVPGKNGEPLAEFTVRQRLPRLIGQGVATIYNGKPARVVLRPGRGRAGSEIDFEQSEAPL